MTTHVQQVQRIARAWGYPNVTADDADFILWEHTGYPGFFRTDKPHRELRRQLRRYFRWHRGIDRVLDYIGWPAGDRDLDTGVAA